MSNKKKVVKAIILAGGYSKRMNLSVPKQLVKINHRPLLSYTLDVFEKSKAIESIVLVVHKKIISQSQTLIKQYGYKKIEQLCLGGKTRQQSVFNALQRIRDCDYVVIHDAVRPFVTQKDISRIIKAVKEFGAATCAVKVIDTIVEAEKNFLHRTLPRHKLWHIQTPQAFKFDLIVKAHQKAYRAKIFDSTDDAQLVIRFKDKTKIVEGSHKNLKVTTPFDLYLTKLLL
jgi:2-C-methyl-D-erythritol 4-phosphate cytidylyltransferase